MKKILLFLIVLGCIFVFSACGGNGEAVGEEQTENNTDESSPVDVNTGVFNKNASLDETVLVDEAGIKITATGLNYTDYSVDLALTIENNSGKNLSFVSGSLGYSCNSINGYMVSDGYLNCDVANGKKANESISFSYDGLMLYGINEIADMEIGFDISDDEYNDVLYSGPRQMKTSAFDAHDYEKDYYQEAITSRAVMDVYGYEMTTFSQEKLYDVNGVKLLSSGVMTNQDGESMLLLEFENTTDNMVSLSTSDIEINGLIVKSSSWSYDTVNPGKRSVVDIEISSVLAAEYWSVYGIKEVGSITLSLRQLDEDSNEIAEKTAIEVVVPDVKAEYDETGMEVYNNDGLRIVAKTILEDSSEYSSDMHVLLLAENKSGKTLEIDDVYDSLAVNGFMTDYTCDRVEMADGECAAIEIVLLESALESNNIASVSDIKEVEIGFEISDSSGTIGEPVVTIPFEELEGA